MKLWDVASGAVLSTLHGHADAVLAVAFAPAERFAVSAAKDSSVRVWQLDAREARASTQDLTRLGRAAIAAACSLTQFQIVPALAAAR